MAKKTNSPSKTRAWNRFSQWVRVRDCLYTTGLPFVGRCVTCDKKFHIRALQAGHCFPGRKNARLFQEELVNAQDFLCNEGEHGRPEKYLKVMQARYGEEQVEAWRIEGLQVIRDRDMDFSKIEEKYKQLTSDLLRSHGQYVSYEDMLEGQRL